jgi:transposase
MSDVSLLEYMDETLPLPNDLAACQRLMARLAAHIRDLKMGSNPSDGVVPDVDSHNQDHAHQGSAQASLSASNPMWSTGSQAAQPSRQNRVLQLSTDPLQAIRQQELPPVSLRIEDLVAQVRDRDVRLDEQAKVILELQDIRLGLQQDVEKLQLTLDKLLKQIYGRRGERFLEDPTQQKLALDFGDDPQAEDTFQDAIEDARKVVQEVEARRQAKKPAPKTRSEKFPDHLPRVEKIISVPDAQKACATHGERTLLGYDSIETLKIKRPELYVEVTKYPKYVCSGHADCGVVQPERPKGLLSGNRFDTSIGGRSRQSEVRLSYALLPAAGFLRGPGLDSDTLNAAEHPGRHRGDPQSAGSPLSPGLAGWQSPRV